MNLFIGQFLNEAEPAAVDSFKLATLLTFGASALGVLSFVKILHVGILSEPADEIDPDLTNALNEILLAVSPVADQILNPLSELAFALLNLLEIVIKPGEITGLGQGLAKRKGKGRSELHRYNGDAGELQPSNRPIVAAAPKPAYPEGFSARFRSGRSINGCNALTRIN